ncbi:unnamed protein product [Phytophthora fragariaefolia]|uniref:Unnamed protein product n=1 Tax=Phytophthora fragariaefolia TaxID=1490495 RepID=A0A9W6XAV4_9STRA|nr:unnamed protein product [Phytophthora fragariaefolia]
MLQVLHSVMDPEVDVGNGLRGPDVMAEQTIIYSTFIKFIRLTMTSYDIVTAEDSVIIKTQGTLRFQVLRNTIDIIFPHVLGNECLVAQLVGQEVEPSIGITFFFNLGGKCCRYKIDVDFVGAFASIVKEPEKLEMLFGKALIAENCMLGILDEPREPHIEVNSFLTPRSTLEQERDRLVDELEDLRKLTKPDTEIPHSPLYLLPSKPIHIHNGALFKRIVNDYYLMFENGYRLSGHQEHAQADFLSQIFAPSRTEELKPGCKYVQARWQALCECFNVLEFKQTGAICIEYDDQVNTCAIRSSASYALQLTLHSLELVFPHVLPNSALVTALVGNVLVVPSELVFTIGTDSGLIAHIVERMDFVERISKLLQNREAVSFVMSEALLSLDGVRCYRP